MEAICMHVMVTDAQRFMSALVKVITPRAVSCRLTG
jgi:hypothetical protein